jgi:hypothetical protein
VRGPGIDGGVAALTQSGADMIVGGQFTTISGAAIANVARWDGSTFQPLGSGTSDVVFALLTLDDGDIGAGGLFVSAGGVTVNSIARWNGSA